MAPFPGLTDAEANALFVRTGGNPLALKLLAGLPQRLSPADILELLSTGHETSFEQMYRRIYRSVWHLLDADAWLLLHMMPLVDRSGGSLDQLKSVAGLDEAALLRALETLHQHSLLEVRGALRRERATERTRALITDFAADLAALDGR